MAKTVLASLVTLPRVETIGQELTKLEEHNREVEWQQHLREMLTQAL